MGLLDDVLAMDAQLAFADPDGFGEALAYKKAIGGAQREVCGVVERMSPQPGNMPAGTLLPMMRVTLPNSTTRGITSAEWQNGDQILIAERLGGTPRWMMIHWPRDERGHDAGMITFEIR